MLTQVVAVNVGLEAFKQIVKEVVEEENIASDEPAHDESGEVAADASQAEENTESEVDESAQEQVPEDNAESSEESETTKE